MKPTIDHEHEFAAIFHTPHSNETITVPLVANSLDEARETAEDLAMRHGYNITDIEYMYRLNLYASTKWVNVGQDTNYDEVMKELLSPFNTPNTMNPPSPTQNP